MLWFLGSNAGRMLLHVPSSLIIGRALFRGFTLLTRNLTGSPVSFLLLLRQELKGNFHPIFLALPRSGTTRKLGRFLKRISSLTIKILYLRIILQIHRDMDPKEF